VVIPVRWRRLGTAATAVGGATAVAALALRRRFARRRATLVAALDAAAETGTAGTYDPAELAGLPDPVRRYLDHVLPRGHPYTRSVELHQSGEIRIGDRPDWHPFTAVQRFAVDPPGFVWDADVGMAPLVWVRVLDAFVGGEGHLSAKVWSVVPVADATPGPDLDRGELLRYLAEAAWFPTALLPGRGVAWEPVDGSRARATLSVGETTASVLFHFDGPRIARVEAERPRSHPDGSQTPVPWTGYWRDYERRDGVLVPTRGHVEWNLDGGDWQYWRGRVEAISRRS
jgi:hypothetical protein